MNVRDLIKQLLEFDLDEPVFIALGDNGQRPEGSSEISHASLHDKSITCGFGVYIHPAGNLMDADA